MGKGLNHQSLGSMPSRRIGQAGARAFGSRHSRGVEEVREDSPEVESQVCDNLEQAVAAGSHSTYHAEGDSFWMSLPLCTEGSPAVLSIPWRVGFYQSRGRRCGDPRDACFLRG